MLYDTVLKVLVGRVSKDDKDNELSRISTLLPPKAITKMRLLADVPLLDLWYRMK